MENTKKKSPKKSGPYMVSDHGSNQWTPATYDADKNEWKQYSPFRKEGWYVIPDPDLWMDVK